MKLEDINETSIRKVSKVELLNLHFRIHQLYTQAKNRNNKKQMMFLKDKHDITAKEMERRGIKHKSPLGMDLNKVKKMYHINTLNEYLSLLQKS